MKKVVNNKLIKSSEELISMILGLVIVVVVGFLIVNFIQKRRGTVDLPGMTSENLDLEENSMSEETLGGDYYEVRTGDSLWKIAESEYGDGYMWVEIAKENSLNSPGLIEVGQKLKMPEVISEAKATNMITEETNYEVKAGDSLWSIATDNYGDGFAWTKIYEKNKSMINNPNVIEKGMVLVLPIL